MDVLGGELSFAARIDVDQLQKDAEQVNSKIDSIISATNNASQAQQKAASGITSAIGGITSSTKTAINTVDSLRAKLLDTLSSKLTTKQSLLFSEQDVAKAEIYRTEIAAIQKQIERIKQLNATGAGGAVAGIETKAVTELGDVIEKTATKGNLLSKSFNFIKQAAFLIPGIGLAGIFNKIGEGVVFLIGKLIEGKDAIKTFQEVYVQAFNELRTEAQKTSAGDVSRLELLRDILTDTTRSQKERVSALNEYNSIASKANQIDERSIGNLNLINDQISRQITLIEKRAFTTAGEKLLAESAEKLLLAQETARTQAIKQVEVDNTVVAVNTKAKKEDEYFANLEKQGQIRRKIASDENVKNAQREFDARKQAFKNTIDLEGGFTGTVDAPNVKSVKPDRELNKLLSEREQLLKDIEKIQQESNRSGLTKDESAVDRVRTRYQLLIEKVDEYNKKANKKGLPVIATDPIKKAEAVEIDNTIQKQQAEEYLKNLDLQKGAFAKAEEYKLTLGTDLANELTKNQTQGFKSYIDFLNAELDKLKNDTSVGAQVKKDGIIKELQKATTESNLKNVEQLGKYLTQAVQLTQTYTAKRGDIDAKYYKLRSALEAAATSMTGEEYAKRTAALNRSKEDELVALDNALITQSDLYKKLNQNIIGFSRDRIKQEVQSLKDQLKTGTFTNSDGNVQAISPEFKKQIEAYIKTLKEFYNETGELAGLSIEKIKEIAGTLGQVSGIFGGLSSDLAGVNEGLSETFNSLSSITSVASSAATAIADFASGNVIGGITSVVSAIGGIFSLGAKSRESAKKAQDEISENNLKILAGEVDISEQYRERERSQVRVNKLRLQGLLDEKVLLEKQKAESAAQFASLLQQIQQETFVASQKTQTYGGVFGIGNKTRVVDVNETLAGKSFAELEQLNAQGKLSAHAKELFALLQKAHDEGQSIEDLLAQNKKDAQELFTGTTADSLLDSITDGFKNGLRSASDFADSFQDLMKNAIINSLKFKYLEGPLKDFFDQFAADSESGGALTQSEIDNLQNVYNQIINDAATKFDQLQQIAGLNLSSNSGTGNSLVGAIKGMTEQSAELLAGQFGGFRLTAIQQLNIVTQSLGELQKIEYNTSLAVIRLDRANQFWQDVTTGTKKLYIN